MAKTKPNRRHKSHASPHARKSKDAPAAYSPELAQSLLDEATADLQTGNAESALVKAKKLQDYLSNPSADPTLHLPVAELLGEIYIELGDPDSARSAFEQATALDPGAELPNSRGSGADKFLWLAQLSDEGGAESVMWFEKGISALRRDISADDADSNIVALESNKKKLASALCGVVEVYMTDLSWADDAEARCERLVTEATLVAPESPEALQTLANVRISQERIEDAQSALERSLAVWKDLPDQHPDIPDFPTRISLARLLMEAEMGAQALEVLERLISDDDESVEAWYLGGWCLHLLAREQGSSNQDTAAKRTSLLKSSRDWLQNSLKNFSSQEYEDDRLRDHALELVAELDKELGPVSHGGKRDDGEDDWEETDDDNEDADSHDEEMQGG